MPNFTDVQDRLTHIVSLVHKGMKRKTFKQRGKRIRYSFAATITHDSSDGSWTVGVSHDGDSLAVCETEDTLEKALSAADRVAKGYRHGHDTEG